MNAMTIYRYQMTVEDYPEVLMPRSARVLSVAPSRDAGLDKLDLWALVDPAEPLVPHKFRVIGTGNPIGERPGAFLGTVSLLGGKFIGHVFEAAFR